MQQADIVKHLPSYKLWLSSDMKKADTGLMPRPGDKIHIPLPEDEALRLLGKVKPTKDMPRPGATNKTDNKKFQNKSANKQRAR